MQPFRAAVALGFSELCTQRFPMLTDWKESQRPALAAAWGLQDLALMLSTGRGTRGESLPLSGPRFPHLQNGRRHLENHCLSPPLPSCLSQILIVCLRSYISQSPPQQVVAMS